MESGWFRGVFGAFLVWWLYSMSLGGDVGSLRATCYVLSMDRKPPSITLVSLKRNPNHTLEKYNNNNRHLMILNIKKWY